MWNFTAEIRMRPKWFFFLIYFHLPSATRPPAACWVTTRKRATAVALTGRGKWAGSYVGRGCCRVLCGESERTDRFIEQSYTTPGGPFGSQISGSQSVGRNNIPRIRSWVSQVRKHDGSQRLLTGSAVGVFQPRCSQLESPTLSDSTVWLLPRVETDAIRPSRHWISSTSPSFPLLFC